MPRVLKRLCLPEERVPEEEEEVEEEEEEEGEVEPEEEDEEENEEDGVDGKRAALRADPVPDRSAPADNDADRDALI